MQYVIVTVLYVVLPAIILILCKRYRFLNRIGAVVLSYIVGIVLGVSGLSNTSFADLQEVLMSITVPLAIPLLLFSSNVKDWRKLAAQPLYSLLFSLIAVIISVFAGYFIFGGEGIPGFHKISGLLVGLYSGGTPNLASLKMILDVDEEIYLAVHSYDMAIGVFYLFLLMGAGQRLFQLVLPKFQHNDRIEAVIENSTSLREVLNQPSKRKSLLFAVVCSLFIVAIAGGAMVISPQSLKMVVFIFLITALGIAGSSFKKLNSAEGSFDTGMYLILIFSIVVASKVELGSLTDINPSIFGYITFVVFMSLILHVALSKLRNIDADTVIITSAALICSPPFVPVVAGSLRNRSVIVPGLTIGLIGYALGNYLGYLMALALSYF